MKFKIHLTEETISIELIPEGNLQELILAEMVTAAQKGQRITFDGAGSVGSVLSVSR